MSGREAPEIPYDGARCTVAWADWSGRAETIAAWEGFDDRLAGKFYARIARLAESGALAVPQQLQKLHGGKAEDEQGVWEIKATGRGKYGNWRAACFQRGSTWWITHFFRTSHRSVSVKAALEKASQARREHFAAEGATGEQGTGSRRRPGR